MKLKKGTHITRVDDPSDTGIITAVTRSGYDVKWHGQAQPTLGHSVGYIEGYFKAIVSPTDYNKFWTKFNER